MIDQGTAAFRAVILFFVSVTVWAQDGYYTEKSYTHYDSGFYIYDFQMGGTAKAKYFTKDAYDRYRNWQSDKRVMLICSGAFSETWDADSNPVGFTVDDGEIINYDIDREMDGLVMITDGVIGVIDLDALEFGLTDDDGTTIAINPRDKASDRLILANAAVDASMTIFQTQLVYSQDKTVNFQNEYYGKKAERRFLAICSKYGNYHNVIVNVPDQLYLNRAAKLTKEVLDYDGYKVHYILNLDTGGKNIFLVRLDESNITYKGDDTLDKATNLIIFHN